MISPGEYEKKKEVLLKEFLSKKDEGVALGKSTSNLFRYRDQEAKKLDVRHFNNVISVDEKKFVAEVEGMTPYDILTRETLRFGLMPTVVPELKSITIGGAYTGVGIESSSFKFGLVHETILEAEILTAEGKVLVCSPKKNKDLFYGFPNSYGTLGYALKVKVKLVPVKKYVKLKHLNYGDAGEYFKDLEKYCKEKERYDFIDGTIFSKDEMYITLGEFSDSAPYTSDYTGMEIYYKSIQEKKEDYLKVYDYIWRWDTDWFWCSKHFYVQNPLVRFFWGKKHLNSITYWKVRDWWHNFYGKSLSSNESIVQDVEIPIENCEKFMQFFHSQIGVKPIWVCPTQAYNKKVKFDLYPMDPKKLYVNFGFWDVVKSDREEGYYNKFIEKKVKEFEGKKSLYSTSYYSEEEFWKLYNKKVYCKLKKKYDPKKVFLNLYQKCVKRR